MVTCGGPLPEEAQGKPAGEWNTLQQQQQQQQQYKLIGIPLYWQGLKRRHWDVEVDGVHAAAAKAEHVSVRVLYADNAWR
jgi:hypothetical protein